MSLHEVIVPKQVKTGIDGLDEILNGGLVPDRLYLIEGLPGTGKTTFSLQFLMEGVRNNESVLYITLSETVEELKVVATSHGWTLDGIQLFELTDNEDIIDIQQESTLFHPWEMELSETIKRILDTVDLYNPTRVVFDSLSELRLLAQDPLRYRRQVLWLKQFFSGRHCTVLMLDDKTGGGGESDEQLHSISHGVITLERLTLDFGASRRRMEVQKLRGLNYRGGWHDFTIKTGGMHIYPRLIASEHITSFLSEPISSGVSELDELLDGGPLKGTSMLITGPAGTAKTTLALQYLIAAARRGEKTALYEFDERRGTLLTRAKSLGMDLSPFIENGLIDIRQIDPAELSPGEFTNIIRQKVEESQVSVLVIDSLNGYLNAMPQEKQLMLQMHEVLSYLSQNGVLTILINPQHGLVGNMHTNLDISFLADSVLLIRFFEAKGLIYKAISMLKNRGGNHEKSIRELNILPSKGIVIGEPLTSFQGILTGTPLFIGPTNELHTSSYSNEHS